MIALACAVAAAVRRLARPRLAVDLAPRRPDHQRHDHQHRRVRRHGLPEHAHLAPTRRRAPATSRRSRRRPQLTDLPIVGWLFAMFLNQGPITMSVIVIVDRAPGPPVPVALGPADAGRRRASEGRRDGRHRRHPAALSQRPARRDLRRPRRARTSRMEATDSFQAGHDQRSRLHRAGRGDRRPLDADRRVRRGAAVRARRRRSASRSRSRRPPGSWATS